jgi:hypothetical protein
VKGLLVGLEEEEEKEEEEEEGRCDGRRGLCFIELRWEGVVFNRRV